MSQPDIPAAAIGGFGGGGDWPKASIGNYKGVMLCNRPNEFGMQKQPDRSGNLPFNSRVNPREPAGWNPTQKLLPKINRKKKNPNAVLLKHRQFLNNLEQKKNQEREGQRQKVYEQEIKTLRLKEQAEKQRNKIREVEEGQQAEQEAMEYQQPEEPVQTDEAQPAAAPSKKLTADNLSQLSSKKSKRSAVPSSKGGKKRSQKPAWATTEKQQEEKKEVEIDDLIEFAYDLDYEQYMEDYEVRQALAIIKERVQEIKEENPQDNWKQDLADQWNEETKIEQAAARKKDNDGQSVFSYRSQASRQTNASKASFQSRVREQQQQQDETKSQWNASVTSKAEASVEDRIAAKIASEVLRDNAKLRGVHSGASIKKILEKEAKKQLLAQGGAAYDGPVVKRHDQKSEKNGPDASNLPYLHKSPAV